MEKPTLTADLKIKLDLQEEHSQSQDKIARIEIGPQKKTSAF